MYVCLIFSWSICVLAGCWWPLLSTAERCGRVWCLWRKVQLGHLCPEPQARHQWDLRWASLAVTSPSQALVFHSCRPCTANATITITSPITPEIGKLSHQWGVLSNHCTGRALRCHCPCSHMRRIPCTRQRVLCQHAARAGQGPLSTPGSQCQPRAAAQCPPCRPSLHAPPARCKPL